MRKLNRFQTALAVLLLVVPATAGAQCLSTERTVSQPSVFPSHAAGPVAWTGSILGIAKIDIQSNVVYFATYDVNLNQLTADRIAANSTLNGPLALLWNGSEFALFYQTQALQLVFQRIGVSGEPIGTAIAVAPQHTYGPNQEIDIAWDARRNAYDVVQKIPNGLDRGLWLTIVNREGVVQFDQLLGTFIAPFTEPRLAVAPSGEIAVTWIRKDEFSEALNLILVGSDNNVKAVTVLSANGRQARIAANESYFLIVTVVPGPGGTTELRSTRVDLQGRVIAGDPTTFVPPRGGDIEAVSLVWNPTLAEWSMAYLESTLGFALFPGETRLRRFNFPGVTSDTLFPVDPTKNIFAMRFPHVWTGTAYVGTISRAVPRSEGSDTHIVKHCPLLSSISAPAHSPLYAFALFVATASGGTPEYRYAWDFGDTAKGDGRTTSHQYILTGTYTVTLTVTDAAGGVSVSRRTVNVVIPKRRSVGR